MKLNIDLTNKRQNVRSSSGDAGIRGIKAETVWNIKGRTSVNANLKWIVIDVWGGRGVKGEGVVLLARSIIRFGSEHFID